MNLLNDIKTKNILVIGDIMLDTYYSGDVSRISPEAPVPVFRKTGERSVLGGAANVVANLIAAGQNVSVIAMVGNDGRGKKLKAILESQGIDTSLIISLERQTTEKIRLLADNNQQVIRIDVEDTERLNEQDGKKILSKLKTRIEEFNLILLSDYLKGLLTYEFTQGVLQLAKKKGIPVIVDVKDSNTDKYRHACLIKPNLKELRNLTGMRVLSDQEVIKASEYLRKLCNCEYVLTTCGARGMVLIGDGEPYFIDSVVQEVFDVTGAGDTTIAYLAACMVSGFTIREAVDISNYAAGIQVLKTGTSPVYWREVREHLLHQREGCVHKLLSGKAIDDFRKNNIDKKIVFTNGCFDIMHVGHIRYLQEASKLGDILIVALNSDDSVKKLKGSARPVNSESERAEMMCALGCVDYVVIFKEDTPLRLIEAIQPDILVKGGDYSNEYVIGSKEVEERGGKLVLIPFVEGKSTTNIIKKIQN